MAAGGLWRIPSETWEILTHSALAPRPLITGLQAILLPCLAPATAASPASSLVLRREVVTTADGVHLEFQQLPGEEPRLRLIVDASRVVQRPDFDAAAEEVDPEREVDRGRNARVPSREKTASSSPQYNTAFILLEEDRPEPENRHVMLKRG